MKRWFSARGLWRGLAASLLIAIAWLAWAAGYQWGSITSSQAGRPTNIGAHARGACQCGEPAMRFESESGV